MRAVPRPGRFLRPAAAVAVLLLLAWPVSASWGHASRLVAGSRDSLSGTPPVATATPTAAPAPAAPAGPATAAGASAAGGDLPER
jgi:hypothetical protein